jgi:hypothetical protein
MTCRTLLAAAVAAVAFAVAVPSASADQRRIDVDNISIESPGFDFSEGLFIAGGLTESAEVEWLVDDNDLTPSISGELHLNNARDECARLRIDYYTEATTLLTTRYSSERCASDNAHHEYDMVLAPHTDDAIGKVKVTLQRERSNDTWERLGSDWSTLSTLNSNVRIIDGPGDIFAFGNGTMDPLTPGWTTGYGNLEWEFSGGRIRPHLTGILHLDNVSAQCARVRLEYYADGWEYLATDDSATVCAYDNDHHSWSIDQDDFSATDIQAVKVSIQSGGGSFWLTEGTQTLHFGS